MYRVIYKVNGGQWYIDVNEFGTEEEAQTYLNIESTQMEADSMIQSAIAIDTPKEKPTCNKCKSSDFYTVCSNCGNC